MEWISFLEVVDDFLDRAIHFDTVTNTLTLSGAEEVTAILRFLCVLLSKSRNKQYFLSLEVCFILRIP